MEEKKCTKVSVSTFLLIITIIALGVMGFFLYKINDEKTKATEQVSELNNQVKTLENSVNSLQKTIEETSNTNKTATISTNVTETKKEDVQYKTNTSFSSLSGIYVGDAKVEPGTTPDGETEVKLYLYENGSFVYNDSPGLGSGHVGYYTFNDNNLILHEVLACGNDIGRTITSDTITLKINSDNSITDSKLNATLTKSSQKIDNKTDIISTELKNALNNKSLQ